MATRPKLVVGSTVKFKGCHLTNFDKCPEVTVENVDKSDYVSVRFPAGSSTHKGMDTSFAPTPQVVHISSLQNIRKRKAKEPVQDEA